MMEIHTEIHSCFSFLLLLIYSPFSLTHVSYGRKIPVFSTENIVKTLFIESLSNVMAYKTGNYLN